jgi:hypothetical protein
LTYEHAALVAEIDVTTCSLDDPDAFPPTYHTWLHDELSWMRPADGLLRFEKSKS